MYKNLKPSNFKIMSLVLLCFCFALTTFIYPGFYASAENQSEAHPVGGTYTGQNGEKNCKKAIAKSYKEEKKPKPGETGGDSEAQPASGGCYKLIDATKIQKKCKDGETVEGTNQTIETTTCTCKYKAGDAGLVNQSGNGSAGQVFKPIWANTIFETKIKVCGDADCQSACKDRIDASNKAKSALPDVRSSNFACNKIDDKDMKKDCPKCKALQGASGGGTPPTTSSGGTSLVPNILNNNGFGTGTTATIITNPDAAGAENGSSVTVTPHEGSGANQLMNAQ